MIEIRNWSNDYTEEAVSLATRAYQKATKHCENLPTEDMSSRIRELQNEMNENSKYSKAAFEGNTMVGYMRFWGPIEGFFGDVIGAFCPLGGSAFETKDPGKLASMLYQELSKDMILDKVFCPAVCFYATDEQVARSFVMNGFGIRCTDAILNLRKGKQPVANVHNMTIRQLGQGEEDIILQLHKGLVRHMAATPTSLPSAPFEIHNYYESKGERVFVAFDGEEAVGYMCLGDEGETFLTPSSNINHIGGAFVKKEYRGKQVAEQILEYICQVTRDEGKDYLGVDCETLNPTAQRFWSKHFSNYTYSCNRRIDERIDGYDEYLDQEWK